MVADIDGRPKQQQDVLIVTGDVRGRLVEARIRRVREDHVRSWPTRCVRLPGLGFLCSGGELARTCTAVFRSTCVRVASRMLASSEAKNGRWTFDTIWTVPCQAVARGAAAQEQAVRMSRAAKADLSSARLSPPSGDMTRGKAFAGLHQADQIGSHRNFAIKGSCPKQRLTSCGPSMTQRAGSPLAGPQEFRIPPALIPLIMEWQRIRQNQALP